MATHIPKGNGSTTIKGSDGRISGNLPSAGTKGPTPLSVIKPPQASPSTSATKPKAVTDLVYDNEGYVVETPGGWAFSRHCLEMATKKGFDFTDMVSALDAPEVVYPHGSEPDQERRIGKGLCVVVDYVEWVAITVYENVRETDLRDDQRNDKRALAYDSGRKKGMGQ